MELKDIKNIGPKRIEALKKLNIETLEDLVFYAPNYYEDRKTLKSIREIKNDDMALVYAKITSKASFRKTKNGLSLVSFSANSDSKSFVINFFNQPWASKNFKLGESYYIYGKFVVYNGKISINNPIFNKTLNDEIGVIIPIYPKNKGITQKILRTSIRSALENFSALDLLPKAVRQVYKIEDSKKLLENIHFPDNITIAQESIRKMAYTEAFMLNIMKSEGFSFSKKAHGLKFKDTEEEREFLASLPFKLTNGQKDALVDIKKDLESDEAMNRLLQGDVGSGKTVIGQYVTIKSVFSGYQAAFMAPTTILAIQNYEKLKKLADKFNINVALLISKTSKNDRDEIIRELASGNIDILVGTHSLLNEEIVFKQLGAVVIDEQHRFGVNQRAELIEKTEGVNVLVMSATPIPRSLSLILYGDVDISEIKTMPKGRKKIETYLISETELLRVFDFVNQELQKGRQGYFVCPLIEESEKSDLHSAQELYEKVSSYFDNYRVAILTGRTKDEDKEAIMNDFKNHAIDLLVSTTVIEVGIDVPNASSIVIMNSERFGLSQLHQLRGRVGRGENQSYCILVHNAKSEESYRRLKIIERTSDGFEIAYEDLKMRGPGELLGLKQSGKQKFKFLDFEKDLDIIIRAKKDFDEYKKSNNWEEFSILVNNTKKIFGDFAKGVLN